MRITLLSSFLVLNFLPCAFAVAQDSAVSSTTVTTAPGTTVTALPGETVTTTVQSPSSTTTTRVTTAGGQSMMGKLKDGTRIEMDSDGSVYQVYADGARVAAEDGVHTLLDGSVVTTKDGKRIP